MEDFFTRRAFLRRASLHALGMPLALRATDSASGTGAATVLRIGLLDGDDADRLDGALLGLEEARHAAVLFGGDVQLTKISEKATSGHTAIIGDHDAERCARLGRTSLVMNVSCASNALRGERCAPTLFHVAPSERMLDDAGSGAMAWDASLERFGADTLNQRFRSRFGRAMTAPAWTSWLAVKILWEASLRARSTDSTAIARYLTRETTQFDGHKGRPLSFRAWDRQLRQPLYVRTAEKLVEAPAEAKSDESPRETLDRIGTPAAESSCRSDA
jgi:hypothetical protein